MSYPVRVLHILHFVVVLVVAVAFSSSFRTIGEGGPYALFSQHSCQPHLSQYLHPYIMKINEYKNVRMVKKKEYVDGNQLVSSVVISLKNIMKFGSEVESRKKSAIVNIFSIHL